MRTRPAPERNAAAPQSAAAPAIPRPPATASTVPNSPLLLSLGRGANLGTVSMDCSAIKEFRSAGSSGCDCRFVISTGLLDSHDGIDSAPRLACLAHST